MSQGPPPMFAQPPGFGPGPTQKTSGVAIASLITGLLGMCVPFLGVVAAILGFVGLRQTSRDPRVGGRGMAIAGLVLGIVGLLFSTLAISILLPSLNKARDTANRIKCATNLKQIGLAVTLYANDNKGAFPPNLALLAKSTDIELDAFVCPSSDDTPAASADAIESGGHSSYVYLGKGLTTSTAPYNAVVAHENFGAHLDGINVLFADGSVEFLSKAAAEQAINAPRRK